MNESKIKTLTVAEALKTTYLNSLQAKAMAIASLILSWLAFIASIASVYFTYQDSIKTEQWQNSQTELMAKLVEIGSANNSALNKSIDLYEKTLQTQNKISSGKAKN